MALNDVGRQGPLHPGADLSLSSPRRPLTRVPAPLLRRFRILRHLGSGAEGSVYLADDRTPGGGRLSLKILNPPRPETLPLIRMRLGSLARIDHPNIARILDFDLVEGTGCLWIAREYVAGEDLARFGAQMQDAGGPFYPRLLEDVARALLQFHDRGLAHGDLRPANILCAPSSEGPMLKLIDGGEAFASKDVVGSQLLHLRRQDLRSVGASFYAAMTGKTADRRIEPRRWNPTIPRWINRLILRLLIPYSPEGVGTAARFLEDILRASRPAIRGRRLQITLSKPPVLGRDRELRAIRDAVDGTLGGEVAPRVLVFSGDAGSGKSALLREAQLYGRARGAQVVSARAPAGEGLPYEPLLQIMQSLSTLETWRQGARLPTSPADLARRVSGILSRAARRTPCVVVIDDAQMIAPETGDMIRRTVESVHSSHAPVLFLVAFGGAVSAERWAEELRSLPVLRLPLRGLERESVDAILRLSIGLPPDEALIARLHALTGGNPGLLLTSLELLRSRFRREGSTIGIPSLESLPVARDSEAAAKKLLSALDPAVLRAGKALSAHPGFLRDTLSREVLGPSGDGDVLGALAMRGILRRVSLHTYEWASSAVRHELYGRLTPRQRHLLHSRFANVGRHRLRPHHLNTHLFLAYHLARTERPGRAHRSALTAARLLSGVFRYDESADYFDLALRLLPRTATSRAVAILKALQAACRKGGLHRRGKRVSLELLRRRPSLAHYAAAAHFILTVDGAGAAATFIAQALRTRGRKTPGGLALLFSKQASALALLGRTGSAVRSARHAEVYLRECEDPVTASDVCLDLGSLAFLRGDLSGASQLFLRALRLARRARDASREAALCDNIALSLRSQLKLAPALRFARRGLAIKLRRGLSLDSAKTRMVLGALLDDSGNPDASREECLRAREIFRSRGDSLRQAWATYAVGCTHLASEQHPEAIEWFERTLREAPPDSRNGLSLAALAAKTQVYLSTGDLDRAGECLRSGSAHLHPGVGFEARLAWTRAQMLMALASGQLGVARRLLRRVRLVLDRSEARIYSLRFSLIGVMLDLAEGPSAEACARVDALISTLGSTRLRTLRCEALLLGAEAHVINSDVRRARLLLHQLEPLLKALPQPSFHVRWGLLRSRLAGSHAEQIRFALDAHRLATKHELRPLGQRTALQLAQSYEAREDLSSALKYYQEAGTHAGNRSA